jgi:hypothetical protein
VEKALRIFASYAQDNWGEVLPIVAMTINNRDAASTGLAPFFVTHGYHVEPVCLVVDKPLAGSSNKAAAEAYVARLEEATDWAQAAIAAAQDRQQRSANRSRRAAPVYKEGDMVWLNLRHVRTARPSKKLDWLHAKYTVKRVVSSHAVELDVPTGIHPVFHVDLLRPAASDPLPSQTRDDAQESPVLIDDHLEHAVEAILCARWHTLPGGTRQRQVFVKWRSYSQPTWEPLSEFRDNVALDAFEAAHGDASTNDGPLHMFLRPRRRRGGG